MSHEFGPVEPFRERARATAMQMMGVLVPRLGMSAAELADLQTRRARELLAHARERSPFWARRLADVEPARFELADLARIRPVTKAEVMADLDSVFTDRRLTRELCERALAATRREVVPVFGEYLVQATGGSSGVRGIVVSDVATWSEVNGAILRHMFRHTAGAKLVAVVGAASPIHSTGLAAALNQPGKSPVRIVSVPVTLPFREIVARLTELQPERLVGYPSMLVRLARERGAGRLPIHLDVISTTSETLGAEAREVIRRGFGVPIVNTFGSTEGLMGGTAPDDSVFELNSDTCLVELVDRDERPVPDGVASDHILITNLANRVQPLIRYRLDDSFTRAPESPGCPLLRATISGRTGESLRWRDVEIHPLVLSAVLLKHGEVLDYQVRQTACGADVAVVATDELDEARLGGELVDALAGAGLPGAQVRVTRAESIERNPETGKARRFIPLGPEPKLPSSASRA